MQQFPELSVGTNIPITHKPTTQTEEITRSSSKTNENKKTKKKKKHQNDETNESHISEYNTFEYEVEGAPWWMPVNDTIDYQNSPGNVPDPNNNDKSDKVISKPGMERMNTTVIKTNQTVVDDFAQDIYHMDSVKVVVNDNPWLHQQIAEKGTNKRQYVLSIDFQINCRKYILFTSLLLFIVIMTFVSSAYTGFYEFKGYTFNLIVVVILMYGIFVGFVCSEMNRYKTRTVLGYLNVYWSMAWIVVISLIFTAFIYLVLFPNKFVNYCATHEICDATIGSIIFAEMSLLCTLILYVFMMFFYMERIANLVILISNIKDYEFKYESNCFMRVCHKHIYRYLRGWKAFRTIIGKHTGLRISDVLYCSCWFRKCARSSSKSWQSASREKNKKKKHKIKYKDSTDSTGSEHSKQKQKNKNVVNEYGYGHDYDGIDVICDSGLDYEPVYIREQCCWNFCENINHKGGNDAAHGWCLRDCFVVCDCRDVFHGCSECMQDVNVCNTDQCCCCCGTYHTDNVGDCTICCKSILNIFCCGCDGITCGDCDDCGEGGFYICIAIIIFGVCAITFLLPIIVFGCIAAPFWLLAQYLVWKLNDKVPWIIVVGIFVIFLIPPCFIWAYIWTAICLGNLTNKFMNIMCLIWSFFHTIYSSLS